MRITQLCDTLGIESLPVILHLDDMPIALLLGGNGDDAFFPDPHTVPDGIFHQRLDGQRGNAKIRILYVISYFDVFKTHHFNVRIDAGMGKLFLQLNQ